MTTNVTSIEQAIAEAKRFLCALFETAPDGCFVELRPFKPEGGTSSPGRKWVRVRQAEELVDPRLDGVLNVWFGVCPRKRHGGTKPDVACATAVWVDIDKPEAEWPSHLPQPNVIVETSPGHRHCYFLLEEATEDLERVEGMNKRLAYAVGGDPASAEYSHVLRVPGFRNLKQGRDGFRVHLARLDTSDVFTLDQLDAMFPSLPASNGHKRAEPLPPIIDEGGRNNLLASLAGTMRRRGAGESAIEAALLQENAERCDPPLPKGEVRRIARSVSGYEPAQLEGRVRARGEKLWPEPPAPEAFHGILGELVKLTEGYTEADPVAVLVSALTEFAAGVGRGPHMMVGGTRHPVAISALLVGDSSKARKGESAKPSERLHKAAAEVLDWPLPAAANGMSTGEGLIYALRDPAYKTKAGDSVVTDEGVTDKRLLVVEPEFGRVLRVMRRDGNTLSAVLRAAWDGGSLQVMTRGQPLKATDSHVCIIGHVTAPELRRELVEVEMANGFANRLLFVLARRARELPEPPALESDVLAPLADKLASALDFGFKCGRVERDETARLLWAECYHDLSRARPGLAGAVLNRAEAIVLRLSMIYALLDCSAVIGEVHLRAALALWGYAERSAAFIFGDSLGDPVADKIRYALQQNGEMERTAISALFNRHESASRIEAALSVLLAEGKARLTSRETGGRPVEVWTTV